MSDPAQNFPQCPTSVSTVVNSAPRPAPFNSPASEQTRDVDTQTIVLRKDRAPLWPHHMPEARREPNLDSYGPDISRQLATFSGDVSSTFPVTATEVQTFVNCPHAHRLRHRMGFESGRLITVTLDDLERYRVNVSRGRIIHLYLQRHEHGWSEETMRRIMHDTIARSVDYPLASPEQYVDEFLPDIRRFLASAQYELLRTADEVHRERSIYLRVPGQPGCEVEAKPDVMFRTNGRWYIIDYKTASFHGERNPLEAVLHDSLRYEMQAALYLAALRAAVGEHAVDSFTYFYTAHGLAVQEMPTDAWLGGAMALLPLISGWMQKGISGPMTPTWSQSKCAGCDFRNTVCKPLGDPDGAPQPRQDR